LRRNKTCLRHVFERLMKLPVALVEMNNRQLQKNTLHSRRHMLTTFKNLFLKALSVNFQKYVSGRVAVNIIELFHLNFFDMANNRFIIESDRSAR
jgi:hypothetical protein